MSLCQLVPLLAVQITAQLLLRERQAAGSTPQSNAPISEPALANAALASVALGPMLGVVVARRLIEGASLTPFLAAMPVSAGWPIAWACIPLWPGWALYLLQQVRAPLHDYALWLSVANWLYFLPVMSFLAWWGASFRGGGAVRDIGLVCGATTLSILFVRWLAPHAFL
jgi:hypothetical protein